MNKSEKTETNLESTIKNVIETIIKSREKEIISRRFGLFDRKETLEQIGEMLGITRERVRQLEKVVINNLLAAAKQNKLPTLNEFEISALKIIQKRGNVIRISSLSAAITGSGSKLEQARVSFLSLLCPQLDLINEDDNHYPAVTNNTVIKLAEAKKDIEKIVNTIKDFKEPKTIADIKEKSGVKPKETAEALASTSKKLATLNGYWGLVKWPTVNPKNIRDKIYVILKENGKQMHFSEISEAIKESEFKRRDVTTQAIHNELIKDDRFVLIGRGIYALKEWGYTKGTVADIITEVLQEASEPLHRDEIVKRVLKNRFVKETTILLNLQGKSQFERVSKATYALSKAIAN